MRSRRVRSGSGRSDSETVPAALFRRRADPLQRRSVGGNAAEVAVQLRHGKGTQPRTVPCGIQRLVEPRVPWRRQPSQAGKRNVACRRSGAPRFDHAVHLGPQAFALRGDEPGRPFTPDGPQRVVFRQ